MTQAQCAGMPSCAPSPSSAAWARAPLPLCEPAAQQLASAARPRKSECPFSFSNSFFPADCSAPFHRCLGRFAPWRARSWPGLRSCGVLLLKPPCVLTGSLSSLRAPYQLMRVQAA